ncbi:hypothetical protein PROFUN_11751 [Planoprotostelium fungivorum]|uniref:Uncharacterized protein n=1 Tax=Planoprotostelium fungivorum TaxID=1890364 RepID=A0A2P6MYJ3_9EUKA|nr:hypothetical protein PROFUN_11751 [Planoprotostelium fungivorum]
MSMTRKTTHRIHITRAQSFYKSLLVEDGKFAWQFQTKNCRIGPQTTQMTRTSTVFILSYLLAIVSSQTCNCHNQCCSRYGYCGTTSQFCSTYQGCRENCWNDTPTKAFILDNEGRIDSLSPSGNLTGQWKNVVYIMQSVGWKDKVRSLNVPGYNPVSTSYNVLNLAFYTSTSGPEEMAQTWAQLNNDDQTSYLDAYHKAGIKKVLVSLFGGADSNPSRLNPIQFADTVIEWVKTNRLDGVDVDYEDEASFSRGDGALWVISLQKTLRAGLPHHIITHAPQAPHFSRGTFEDEAYVTIHDAVGDTIDWYNVQFYNNGGYDNCNDLMFHRKGYGSKSSVVEIHKHIRVPLSKIVIGKPIGTRARHDAHDGFMNVESLVKCVQRGRSEGHDVGGMMGWELFNDRDGRWGKLASSLRR